MNDENNDNRLGNCEQYDEISDFDALKVIIIDRPIFLPTPFLRKTIAQFLFCILAQK